MLEAFNLQQRIECARRKHVDFIDDDDFILSLQRRIFHIVAQYPDIIDSIIRCAVDFGDIHRAAIGNGKAVLAMIAWLVAVRCGIRTIYRFSQNSRDGSFAAAALAGKKIRVRQPPGSYGIF